MHKQKKLMLLIGINTALNNTCKDNNINNSHSRETAARRSSSSKLTIISTGKRVMRRCPIWTDLKNVSSFDKISLEAVLAFSTQSRFAAKMSTEGDRKRQKERERERKGKVMTPTYKAKCNGSFRTKGWISIYWSVIIIEAKIVGGFKAKNRS